MQHLIPSGSEPESPRSFPENLYQNRLAQWCSKLLTKRVRGKRVFEYLFVVALSALVVLELAGVVFFVRWFNEQQNLSRSAAGQITTATEFKPGALPHKDGTPIHMSERKQLNDRVTVTMVADLGDFAGLFVSIAGSETEHYIQVPKGWKEKVDAYDLTLLDVGQDENKPAAWVKIEPHR